MAGWGWRGGGAPVLQKSFVVGVRPPRSCKAPDNVDPSGSPGSPEKPQKHALAQALRTSTLAPHLLWTKVRVFCAFGSLGSQEKACGKAPLPPRVSVYVGRDFPARLGDPQSEPRTGTLQLHAAFQKPLPAWVCAGAFPFETSKPQFQAAPALRPPPLHLHPQFAALQFE